MMGRRKGGQRHLFYEFRLDEVVPWDHLVRKVDAVLDLSWVHAELAPHYSRIGRPSIDPVLMIRLSNQSSVHRGTLSKLRAIPWIRPLTANTLDRLIIAATHEPK